MSLLNIEMRDAAYHDRIERLIEIILETGSGLKSRELPFNQGKKLEIGATIISDNPKIEQAAVAARNELYSEKIERDPFTGALTIERTQSISGKISVKLSGITLFLDQGSKFKSLDVQFTATSLNSIDFGANYGDMHCLIVNEGSQLLILEAINMATEENEKPDFTSHFCRAIDEILAAF